MTMRLAIDEQNYKIAKMFNLLQPINKAEPICRYHFWSLVENRFKHTRIADVNHMIVLNRDCSSLLKIKPWEWLELLRIIWKLRLNYDCLLYNFPGMSSVKNIPHLHLYKLKKLYK